MAWDSKFIGGHLEINNNYGAQVTAYSKTDNDKRSFCNCEHLVIEAWWQGPEVYVEDDAGHQYIFTSDCNAR